MEEIVKVTLSLPESVATRLRVQAAKDRTTMSEIGVKAINAYVEELEAQSGKEQVDSSPKSQSRRTRRAAA